MVQGKSGLGPDPCGDLQNLVLSPYGYGLCAHKEDDSAVNLEVMIQDIIPNLWRT